MRNERSVDDPAQVTASQLKEIRRIYESADEMYRSFRVELIRAELTRTKLAIAWVPITKQ